MFKYKGAHETIQEQKVELGKPGIMKWQSHETPSLLTSGKGYAPICPHKVSSQLLRTCPWFWPWTTSQPETGAHCPAWTEFPPDSPTYAKGFRHIEPTLGGKYMLSESGNTKSWWYFPEDSEDSGHNDLVKQRCETIIVQTS